LRNEFRDTIRDVLTDRKTIQRGYFQKTAIEKIINANNKHGAYSKEIFSLVTLELWHRMFLDRDQVTLNQIPPKRNPAVALLRR
jgi:asparagine synthase (glutamine-hydrolysing)